MYAINTKTDDHIMRGYLDSRKSRRKGWKTSGHTYNPDKIKGAADEFVAWMKAQQEAV